MAIIKRGNTTFNTEQFKKWQRHEFILQYSGLVKGARVYEIWDEIQKINSQNDTTESDKGLGEKVKKIRKSKRNNEALIQSGGVQETDN